MQTRRKRSSGSVYSSTLNQSQHKFRKMSKEVGKIKFEKVEKPELTKHDSKLLDLAFVMDCTGSMGSYIDSARDNIRKIVEEIVAAEKSDVRLALVEYRDHPPQDTSFVTKVHDFTQRPSTMKDWLSQCSAAGGGDTPEAVADALHDLLKLSWREEATKICVCISDAPPHGLGLGGGDSFPEGCPAGIDPIDVTNRLAEKGVTIYMVGCEPSIVPYKEFFLAVAYMTGGQYVPLTKAQLLTKVIIGGAREEMSLDALMEEVEAEIEQEVAAGRQINEDAMSGMLQQRFAAKGVKVQQLQRNNAELTSANSSPVAKRISAMKSLGEVRDEYKKSGGGSAHFQQARGSFSVPMGAFGAPMAPGAPMGAGFGAPMAFSAPMGAGFGALAPTSSDAYECVESDVSYGQSSRMVQKAMRKVAGKKK